MATNVSSWRTYISDRLTRGATNTALDAAIVDSIREFCQETFVYSVYCSDISVVALTNSYDLKTPAGAAYNICGIKSIRYKEATAAGAEGSDSNYYFLTPMSEDIAEQIEAGSWIFDSAVAPSEYYVTNDWLLIFRTIPTVASTHGIRAYVYVMPVIGATTVDDFFYRDHRDVITYGALYRLLEMYGVTNDLEKAEFYRNRFIEKCADVKMRMVDGHSNAMLKVSLPSFF